MRARSAFSAVIKVLGEAGTSGRQCLIANGMNGIEAQRGKHPLSEAGRVPRVPSQSASQDYIESPCLRNKTNKQHKTNNPSWSPK